MSNETEAPKPRRRGLTSLTLEWIAEKFRKAQRIKEELNKGSYNVDSNKLAEALVNGVPTERK